jgi:hypothetical protein
MMELHDITAPLNDFDEEVLALVLQQPQSPFAQLRSGRELPVRLYVQRVEAERLRQRGEEPDLANGMACFCRTTDCTGRWPIGSNDMDNWQTRPYACVRMWRQDWPGGKLIVDTAPGRNGFLKEPAQTAYRSR